jgi:hypothetical protein
VPERPQVSITHTTALCPTCKGLGWASQWRTYGHAEMHGYYYEPCDDCEKGRRIAASQRVARVE